MSVRQLVQFTSCAVFLWCPHSVRDSSGGVEAPGAAFAVARPNGGEDAGCWMRLDLGACRRLEPTHYCLRHAGCAKPVTFVDVAASKRNRFALRSWELQGAANATGPWTTLRKHVKDPSLEAVSYSEVSARVRTNCRHMK